MGRHTPLCRPIGKGRTACERGTLIKRVALAEATEFKCHQGFNLRMGEQHWLIRWTDWKIRLQSPKQATTDQQHGS